MTSSAAVLAAVAAAVSYSAGFWWCGVVFSLVVFANTVAKLSEVWVAVSLTRRVAACTSGLKADGWAARQNMLVIVNQNAGSGRGGIIFRSCVVPMLEASKIAYKSVFTTKKEHASQICAELAANGMRLGQDPMRFGVIVCVSGDGLLHEALQGLAMGCNHDAATLRALLRRISLAIVPAGSGNGVAASLGAFDPVDGVLNIVQGNPTQVDLFSIHSLDNPSAPPLWDMHFFCWAAFSDHDWLIEGPFRWMGPLIKMILAPVVVIMRSRAYEGTVDLLPVTLAEEERKAKHYRDPAELACCPESDPAESVHSNGLAESRPGEWKRLQGRFWCLAVGNLNYGGADVQPTPHAQRCEGAVDVIMMRQHPSSGRFNKLKLFLEMEKGSHIESERMDMYKVRGMVLRPGQEQSHGSVGHLQCSGEEIAFGTKLVQSHQGMLQMLVRHK
eukprot:TRINITY_DN61391_c0_g1_i1.p1 TRINITY_DN61391_c0_g1~~TRINITY_DN61391_c0_g1_i1.p1  ORF type:complete len:444 (-),score=82.83 TRINITY_DN61391_c0_g1_i1:337-1668(-)